MRVGNALGAGDTAGAILTSKVSLICAGNSTIQYIPYFIYAAFIFHIKAVLISSFKAIYLDQMHLIDLTQFLAVLAIIQGVVLGATKTVIGFLFTSDE